MKIFVTVGTHSEGFDRLLSIMDKWANQNNAEIFALTGNSKYKPKNFNGKAFCTYEKYISELKKADIVVSHAGSGSIIDTLNLRNLLIIIPRIKKLGEHTNRHQLETAKTRANNKLEILADENNFAEKMELAKKFKPEIRYEKKKTIEILEKFLNELD